MSDARSFMPGGIAWRQPAVFAVATAVCAVLAIWAVVLAPVGSSPVPGVSGLYIAAAVYVPLALWFGIWGCLAGYFSCVIMGLYAGYPIDFVLIWSLADFFEGFVPLLIYRSLRVDPVSDLSRPRQTRVLNGLLAANVVVAAIALVQSMATLFIATFVAAIALLITQAIAEDRRTWLVWMIAGVFIASMVSGIFGVGALTAFGIVPMPAFPTVFYGWVFGDIIVLATIGTILMTLLTPYVARSRFYIQRFFS